MLTKVYALPKLNISLGSERLFNISYWNGLFEMKRPKIDIPTSVKNPELVKKRRAQIIRAAVKLFAQKGFHKTTIRDIANKTGLSLGAIYEYVRSKEEIVVLNQEVFLDSAGAKLRKSIENIKNPLEKLRRLIHTELQMMDRYADYLLFVTRERHYLTEKYMNMTLQLERIRLSIFDEVLEECIQSGQISPCNVGLTTQLIKVMIDAWVMKGWDLKDRVDLAEMEATILNLLWNGLPKKGRMVQLPAAEDSQLEGKSVLVVNGGTALGTAIVSSLVSKGAYPFVYTYSSNGFSESPVNTHRNSEKIRYYSSKDYGPLDRDLFKKIASDMKQMDIYIHDLGIGNTVPVTSQDSMMEAGRNLDANLICAQETADPLKEVMSEREKARCIYLAPWSWDRYANPIHYEAVKGAAIAMTNMMAKELSHSSANVHCIIPGYIRSERSHRIEERLSDELIDKVSSLCLGDMSDVTNAVLFLSSDVSKFLTGQVLHVSRDHSDSGKRG